MGQILFSLSLSLYIPSAMDYGQSCDLFRLIQMVSALNSTSPSNYHAFPLQITYVHIPTRVIQDLSTTLFNRPN